MALSGERSKNPFGDVETCCTGDLLQFGDGVDGGRSEVVKVSNVKKTVDPAPLLTEETTSLMNELSLFFVSVPSAAGSVAKVRV